VPAEHSLDRGKRGEVDWIHGKKGRLAIGNNLISPPNKAAPTFTTSERKETGVDKDRWKKETLSDTQEKKSIACHPRRLCRPGEEAQPGCRPKGGPVTFITEKACAGKKKGKGAPCTSEREKPSHQHVFQREGVAP